MNQHATLLPEPLTINSPVSDEQSALDRVEQILLKQCLGAWTTEIAERLSLAQNAERFAEMPGTQLDTMVQQLVRRLQTEVALRLYPLIDSIGLSGQRTSISLQLQRGFAPRNLLAMEDRDLRELIKGEATQDHTHYILDPERGRIDDDD